MRPAIQREQAEYRPCAPALWGVYGDLVQLERELAEHAYAQHGTSLRALALDSRCVRARATQRWESGTRQTVKQGDNMSVIDQSVTEHAGTGEQTRARYPDAEGHVERDGVRVFYEVYGNGEPTILFCPTWSLVHSRVWKMQIPYMARHHRVVVFDARGNGKSDRPQNIEAYAESEFARDALDILDATGTEQAVVVGLSRGAQRALLLATEHPERVTGLVFVGPWFPASRSIGGLRTRVMAHPRMRPLFTRKPIV